MCMPDHKTYATSQHTAHNYDSLCNRNIIGKYKKPCPVNMYAENRYGSSELRNDKSADQTLPQQKTNITECHSLTEATCYGSSAGLLLDIEKERNIAFLITYRRF